jgi:hypothetical protein
MTNNDASVNKTSPLTGIFDDRESADKAYHFLLDKGYDNNNIDVVMSDDTRKRYFDTATIDEGLGGKAVKGAKTGFALGGTVGIIMGVLATIGTNVVLPGIGLVIAGPLAAALSGLAAGGVAGGLAGALIAGVGYPEQYARIYEESVSKGSIVLSVKPKDEADATAIAADWAAYGHDIHR